MPPPPRPLRLLKTAATLLFCAAYLGATAYFFARHVVGDSLSRPEAYFFTWDMFPDYETESTRRLVLGLTNRGRFIQLLPAEEHRFRWGIDGTVSRIDIDGRGVQLNAPLRRRVALFNEGHPEDRIESVLLVEQYWPSRFNLPDDLYEDAFGEPHPHRRSWRIVRQTPVDETGSRIDDSDEDGEASAQRRRVPGRSGASP